MLNIEFSGSLEATHGRVNIGGSEPVTGDISGVKMYPVNMVGLFPRMTMMEASFERTNEPYTMNWVHFKFENNMNISGNGISIMVGKYESDSDGNIVWNLWLS